MFQSYNLFLNKTVLQNVTLGLYTEVALIYLAFCTILTWLQRLGERKLASYGGERA